MLKKSENRARQKKIMVRVSDEEYEAIKKHAESCDLSMPELLRRLGMGYLPKSTLDAQHILALSQLKGDLGRLGGLLKLWLSSDRKAQAQSLDIPEMINLMRQAQQLIIEKVKAL